MSELILKYKKKEIELSELCDDETMSIAIEEVTSFNSFIRMDYWIDKDDAIGIINHLKKQFDL